MPLSSAVTCLVWEKPDGSQIDFPLGEAPLLVGREEDADIQVDEPLVSRAHARIEFREGRYVLVDLGSTNLTRVNGEVVLEKELRHGDEIRFARARCYFRVTEENTATETTANTEPEGKGATENTGPERNGATDPRPRAR